MAKNFPTLHVVVVAVLMFLSLSFVVTNSAPEDARVTHLPGFNGTFPSKHYSGYVTINEKQGKKLFYYFVQSEGNPSKDPVVLWLNGGPGCSSFGGFVYEHGPFHFEKTQGGLPKLSLNKYSWSKVSNILYLDSPAGVGFSYSKNWSDYSTGDLKTASDTHTFLLKWFNLYKEFISNPFFISGESFAGVYVPTLAAEIDKGLDVGRKPVINFKGYLIGNGVTDEFFDGNALVPFAHGMGLISDDLFEAANKECKGNFYNTTDRKECKFKIYEIKEMLSLLNIYNILEPCYHGSDSASTSNPKLPSSFKKLGTDNERPLAVRKRMFGRAWPLGAPVKNYGMVPTWPQLAAETNSVPCMNDEVASSWLNNEEVREAIHAESKSVVGDWVICKGVGLGYKRDTGSMIPYHRNLTSKGYRALIFSGDHDMCIPYTGSEAWTRSMGYKIVEEWRPWLYDDEQIGGYLRAYDKNLTFLTIKGAGHTVAEYKPRQALNFYSRWIAGKPM